MLLTILLGVFGSTTAACDFEALVRSTSLIHRRPDAVVGLMVFGPNCNGTLL
jgi:hypothetical protein